MNTLKRAALSLTLIPLFAAPGVADTPQATQYGYPVISPERQNDLVCYMQRDPAQSLNLNPLCGVKEMSEPVLGTGDIQTTLRWSSSDDLDLAVRDPSGQIVSYMNPRVASGGALDVDSNADCQETVTNPVENVFWPTGGAPSGNYVVQVNLFRRCARSGPINFNLRLLVRGQVQTKTGRLDEQNPTVNIPISIP